jgi:phosphopantothenoylcysteine decarboxylase/phosphopantothenate--cysteine ligase
MGRLDGRTLALGVTGSIAAYKAVEVARLCLKEGARVLPVLTRSATRFVGAVTFSGITGESVAEDMWDADFAGERHVALAKEADLVAVVPATADVLARFAQGRADDLLSALVLCARGPVLAAPAMHPRMWEHPATARNVAELLRQGRITFAGPVNGVVASGESGVGRMAEPEAIVEAIVRAFVPRDLKGRRIVVTAGPTVEDLDPVRFIGNRSTGKMGFAIAERAAARGAEVILVAGPVAVPPPAGARRVDVRSALQLRDALWAALGEDLSAADALIMTAAVADYRAAEVSAQKTKKAGERIRVELVRNPDLLAEVGARRAARRRPVLVGFAVETGDEAALRAYAREKLTRKGVDVVVANAAQDAFGKDDNRAVIVGRDKEDALPRLPKLHLADVILARVRDDLAKV